ncbi:glycosyltransferase family 2 protein [Arenicella sp. 4NH20-0111]|uniref:glycosyltransferase family 2 protein n=1 Tax=Arenicella sp. 4NH20-0111 TaxID=3127648 RepID=UPI003109C4F2
MNRVAVILPAYNEEQTIVRVVQSFHSELPEASIWVVNNHSLDQTESLAKKEIERLGCKGGVLNEYRQGKGNAIRRAFLEIEADIFILADADLACPASEVHFLMTPIVKGEADMVVGDRHTGGDYASQNKRALHSFGNRLVRTLINRLFKAKLVDPMCGYRAFSRLFVKNYPILVEGFEIETDMTLHALDKRFRIREVPISFQDRPEGSVSKLNTFRDGARVLRTIWNIFRYYRPLVFFGGAAIVFAVLGLLTSIPVWEDWFRDKYIHHIPLTILSSGLEIVALLLGAVGLILDSIAHQDRRRFERDLMN